MKEVAYFIIIQLVYSCLLAVRKANKINSLSFIAFSLLIFQNGQYLDLVIKYLLVLC